MSVAPPKPLSLVHLGIDDSQCTEPVSDICPIDRPRKAKPDEVRALRWDYAGRSGVSRWGHDRSQKCFGTSVYELWATGVRKHRPNEVRFPDELTHEKAFDRSGVMGRRFKAQAPPSAGKSDGAPH